jgi:hypothetical protein
MRSYWPNAPSMNNIEAIGTLNVRFVPKADEFSFNEIWRFLSKQ